MLRPFSKTDVPQLFAIEQSVQVVPWTEDTFKTCLQAGYSGWVAVVDHKVIGFIVVSMHTEDCHILNLGVLHAYQRQGWGKRLLNYALEQAKADGAIVAYLEVRKSNHKAINLYQHAGFKSIGERKNYYHTVNGHEDAWVLAKDLMVLLP